MEILDKSHYDLNELKELLENEKTRVITVRAQNDAFTIGYLTDDEIIKRCLELRRSEIYKTMTTHHDHTLWQDVYKTKDPTRTLYIKLQKNKQNTGVVVSFKEAD
jgi:motility quorum-sensing regulator/GCU-specific mRNA interferase toxin